MPTRERADRERAGLVSPRCSARNREGKPCGAYAIRGGRTCRVHGGAAGQVKAAAKRRFEDMALSLAERVIGIALNENVNPAVALAAARDGLDRAGLQAPRQSDLSVTAAPVEAVFSSLVGGSRSDYRASVGRPDPEPLPEPERSRQHLSLARREPDDDVIDVEAFTIESSIESEGDDEHQAEEPCRETLANSGQRALPPGYLSTEDALAQARAANTRCQTLRRRQCVSDVNLPPFLGTSC